MGAHVFNNYNGEGCRNLFVPKKTSGYDSSALKFLATSSNAHQGIWMAAAQTHCIVKDTPGEM